MELIIDEYGNKLGEREVVDLLAKKGTFHRQGGGPEDPGAGAGDRRRNDAAEGRPSVRDAGARRASRKARRCSWPSAGGRCWSGTSARSAGEIDIIARERRYRGVRRGQGVGRPFPRGRAGAFDRSAKAGADCARGALVPRRGAAHSRGTRTCASTSSSSGGEAQASEHIENAFSGGID